MEFWPENQGQSSLYSKFGTMPGRNCTHNYHDRHQAIHYPLYYSEQQDQNRESSYWTVPGSRTGGAPQEYTSWTDQDLTTPASSHFPFILDRHPQQHHDLGEYQPHDARDREWTTAQRAAREYERGFPREGWQRRWEPCTPVRYNREVSTKRSDSSYRELEAWAARYSHSLPRRRRIEAELRGASQGLLESSRAPERDSRSGTDPRVAALQQVLQSANIRELGMWDRGGRQQAPTYYPSQTPATSDTSHVLDMKDKTSSYQRRMFSQPPGYIAPPPYNVQHKSSPVSYHSDSSWEQEGKRQSYWSQPTLRKLDVPVDHRKGEKEDFTKPDVNQCTYPELEGLKNQRQEADALKASSPVSTQKPHISCEGLLSVQQPQVLQEVQNKKINEEPSSKVIEGRKFRLNKKTGGLTIFCLVSRIAGTTETPSLPICTSQTNIQDTELGRGPRGGDINQTNKLADEVDFRAPPTLTEQSDVSDLKVQSKETPTSVESEIPEDNLNKSETDVVVPAKASTNDADSTSGRQISQSVQPSVKYPLWREPSFTSRAETESSSTCLKADSEEDGQSDVLHNQEVSAEVLPIDIEVRRLDIKKDTESEENKGLLVIDTTCVVVKMELIPSPKKEHVHILDSTPHTDQGPPDIQSLLPPECVQSNNQLNQDVTTDQNAETDPLHVNESPETELNSDLEEKNAAEGERELSLPCMSSSSVPERETLEERAERILGIPLHDCIAEQQPEDATSLLNSCVEDQEGEPQIKDNDIDDAIEQVPEDPTEIEVGQTEGTVCSQENDDAKDQVAKGGDDVEGLQKQTPPVSEVIDSEPQLETDTRALPEIEMTEDLSLKSTSEEGTTEQSQEENHDTSSQLSSQCLSPPTKLSNPSSLSPSLYCEAPNHALPLMLSSSSLYISESNKEEGPDPGLIALKSTENPAPCPETSFLPDTPSQQLPSTLPPGSDDLSPSSTPHRDHSPSPSPLDLIDQTAKAASGVEDQDAKGETSQLTNETNEISDAIEDLDKDMMSQQQLESDQTDNTACVKESNITNEQQTKEANEDLIGHIIEQKLKISQENATEVNILQQQPGSVEAEDVDCMKVSEDQLLNQISEDLTDHTMEQTLDISEASAIEVKNLEQQLESYMAEPQKEVNDEPTGLLEQTISQENMTESHEANTLQQQLDNDQEEEASCLKETYMTKELSQKEVNDDPTCLLEQTISQENMTESHEANTLQLQLDNDQEEEASSLKEAYMTKEQSQTEADEDPMGLLEQTISKENATDSQTEIEIEILQTDHSNSSQVSQLDSNCEASQSPLDVLSPSELPSPPHVSDTELVSNLEIDSVCPSTRTPAAGVPETVPPPLHLDSCEESLQFPSSSFSSSDSSSIMLPSSSTLQEQCGSVPYDQSLKEPQYPKSLWDAVNRIRKHTAPDSENEEEEVSEMWDRESIGEDLGCPVVVEDINSEKAVFDEAGRQEVSAEGGVEDVEAGQIQQDPCHEELSGHAEEDTLSCSSVSSHGSGDTVIVADEDGVEDAGTESKTDNDEEFETAEGEQCYSGEVGHKTAAREEEVDGDENEPHQSKKCPVEVVDTTTSAVEMMEKERKENEEEEEEEEEEEVFIPSEVSDEGVTESQSVK